MQKLGNAIDGTLVVASDPSEEHERVRLKDATGGEAHVERSLSDRERSLAPRCPRAESYDDATEDFLMPIGRARRHDDLPIHELDFRGGFRKAKKLLFGNHGALQGGLH